MTCSIRVLISPNAFWKTSGFAYMSCYLTPNRRKHRLLYLLLHKEPWDHWNLKRKICGYRWTGMSVAICKMLPMLDSHSQILWCCQLLNAILFKFLRINLFLIVLWNLPCKLFKYREHARTRCSTTLHKTIWLENATAKGRNMCTKWNFKKEQMRMHFYHLSSGEGTYKGWGWEVKWIQQACRESLSCTMPSV